MYGRVSVDTPMFLDLH